MASRPFHHIRSRTSAATSCSHPATAGPGWPDSSTGAPTFDSSQAESCPRNSSTSRCCEMASWLLHALDERGSPLRRLEGLPEVDAVAEDLVVLQRDDAHDEPLA